MSGEATMLAALTAAISATGGADHVDRLTDLIGALVLHDKVTVVRSSATQRPEFVSWRNYSPALVRKYLETFYVFDPFYADWRRNRRPPQALAGVGFSAQGLFEGTRYRRLPASHAPEPSVTPS